MFDDITEMEREIEAFRKNVVASSELVEGISRLTEVTEKQKESFSESTEELLKKLESCIASFKNDHESALQTLSDRNGASIDEFRKKIAAERKSLVTDLEKMRAGLQQSLEDAALRADSLINDFSEKLKETESVIKNYQSASERKYADFVKQLENANVSELSSEIQNIKRSIRIKFAVLMGGIGITLFLTIIGLFIG